MSSTQKVFLAAHHVTIRHLNKVLLPGLNFTMYEDEHWAITGKSGSGKSALLQTLMGKFNRLNGTIDYPFYDRFVEQHRIHDPLFTYRQLISLVSQQPHFRNKQNMSDFYYQQRFHAWDSEAVVRVEEFLHTTLAEVNSHVRTAAVRFPLDWVILNLRLDTLLEKTLIQLSNGETRRLLIALALLKQPRLLLMDNPFTGLDTTTRTFFHQLLNQIVAEGTQLMLATSSQEIPDCITHVLELDQGRITHQWRKETYQHENERRKKPTSWQPGGAKLAKVTPLLQAKAPAFDTAISLQHIHVQYGPTVILDDVNWDVKRGEKWALLGPNGAGKSTLLSLISGDNPQAYANTIYLFDQKRGSGESIWDIKRKIGFVSPEMHQYFHSNSSCLDIVLSGYSDTIGVLSKRITEDQRVRARAWMELLDMDALAEKKFQYIAAGEQRLVLLIRALVKDPPLLILDEPCQGLDQQQKDHFKAVIEYLCRDKEKTLIYVSHYVEEIPGCVDRLLYIEKGRAAVRNIHEVMDTGHT